MLEQPKTVSGSNGDPVSASFTIHYACSSSGNLNLDVRNGPWSFGIGNNINGNTSTFTVHVGFSISYGGPQIAPSTILIDPLGLATLDYVPAPASLVSPAVPITTIQGWTNQTLSFGRTQFPGLFGKGTSKNAEGIYQNFNLG